MSGNAKTKGTATTSAAHVAAGPLTWRAWWSRYQSDSRARGIAFLHLLALVNLALAQPIYNLIALEPMVLVVHRARPLDIVLLAVSLSWLLPLTLWLGWLLLRRMNRPGAQSVLLLMVFLLLAAVALPAWKRAVFLPGAWLIGLTLLTATFAVWAYSKYAAVRLLVTYAALSGLVFPALFLFRPPATLLLFPADSRPAVEGRVEEPAPVVMLVFDEFSQAALLDGNRQLDAEKYPNFARLAAGSTWYRNTTSMSGYTQYAVPALLTGRRPRQAPASLGSFPENLFTLLANQYELTVFEPYTTLCPVEVDPTAIRHSPWLRLSRLATDLTHIYQQFLLPFDLVPPSGRRHAQEYTKFSFERQRQKKKGLIRYGWSKNRAEQFEHFLEVIQPAGPRPRLYFGHIVLPHIGYEYLPSGRRHDSQLEAQGNRWSHDAWQVAQQQQQYLLQVAYVDRLLGRLLDRLQATGLYDDCLLVVTADHGVTFRPGHHTRDATPESAPDIMWIPLFIKAPHQTAGAVSDRNLESIDILPTMVDLLHISRPWQMDGISAADPATPPRSSKTLFRTAEKALHFSAGFSEKNSTLSQQLQWFSAKGGVDALFQIGAHPELLGKHRRALRAVSPPRYRVSLADGERLRGVTPQTDPWPCFLHGEVAPEAVARGPVTLAVIVNDRIEAVTRSYRTASGQIEWQALVREAAIHEGDNEVQLFIVYRIGTQFTLEPTLK